MNTITLGNFDGIHAGHLKVIEKARSFDGDTSLVCFEPVARQYFNDKSWNRRLTTVSERAEILSSLGMKNIIIIPFDMETVSKSPDEFLSELHEKEKFRRIVVGYDFHFGRNRSGTVEYLFQWCTSREIDTIIVPPLKCGDGPVKSEKIRLLLENGDIQYAEELLGRHYSITGVVSRGKGQGRQIGYPTLNVRVPGCKLLPKSGSYAGYVYATGGSRHLPAAIFVPRTATGPVEAHIIDHSAGDLYGSAVSVSFRKRLRDEATSINIEKVKELIAADVENVRQYALKENEWRSSKDEYNSR
ncbi:MAG: riboflavin kinase [Candidatus Fermentibacteria bacterium]